MKIHVLLTKGELSQERLPGKTAVVLDVLFATSSIVAALEHGAREVVPAVDRMSCLAAAQDAPQGSYILSGELHADTLEGFTHPTPLALLEHDLTDKRLFYTTTNGTVALQGAAGATHVYAAALLNARAMACHLLARHASDTVLLVCSGSEDNFNLEDFYGAGYLVSLILEQAATAPELTDAARAAMLLHDGSDARQCLLDSRVGRLMRERGLVHEIEFAARKSALDVVAKLEGGRLRRLPGTARR